MIADDFLAILMCPLTRQPLALATPEILAELNGRSPVPQNQAGAQSTRPLHAALVSADHRWAYPVQDDIPVLLADEAIAL